MLLPPLCVIDVTNHALLGKAVSCSSLSTPTQLHKNGPWAQNTSLPSDQELTQSVKSLSACVGVSFLVSGTVSIPFFCLLVNIKGPQAHSQISVFPTPWRSGRDPSTVMRKENIYILCPGVGLLDLYWFWRF